MKELPKISIVTCTYNGERVIGEYFNGIFAQDYPKNKIELILNDGGSTDKTLEIIKKYQQKYPKIVKIYHNPEQYSIGRGFGMDMATRKAKGEIIVQLDQDNILVQKDWLKNMIQILIKNKDITGVQSRLFIPEKASLTDKYVNAIGIEDPFAIPYSLNAQIALNPKKFDYNKNGKFFIYEINKEKFYYAGDNGFAIRKKDFLETGGYTQDIDNFWRMANSNKKYKIAVPKDIRLYHKTTTELKHLLNKRIYYIGHYLLKNYERRDFYWFDFKKNTFKQNLRFIKSVLFNLAFIPGLIQGLSKAVKEKKSYWLIHSFVLFLITIGYIYAFFYANIFKKQREAGI
ncbi:glycosyltransferase [Candidatus Pacearchaeota archaeon]|nr:glycosyltransferase [Candidatus Pacearchaeota archaeon]